MVHLRLFGPPSLRDADDAPVQLKSRKTEALLYFLCLTPGTYRRSYLANLLWSEWPEEKALSNLRYALWNLRQALGEDTLGGDRVTITFHERAVVWCDVRAFRELLRQAQAHPSPAAPEAVALLQQAAELYRGDLLAGFEAGDAPDFQDWLHQQRMALHEQAIQTLTHLSAHYAGHRRLAEAITATRRLLDLEPWREAAHRQLMLLLALNGRRDAALSHYQHCCQVLATELGLDPEAETVALAERIRAGELEPAGAAAGALAEPGAPSPLVGRHHEHAWLVERWELACRGQSRLALIRGEAGVGKTRLVDEFCRSVLAHGGLVLRGRCYEFAGPVPYQPIAAALQRALAGPAAGGLALSEVWLAELAQLLPELREQLSHLPPALPTGGRTDRYRLFEAVAQLLRALTLAQPALFFLDDLHWADADTLDLVGYLVRRLTDCPLLVIGAYRPGEVLDDHAMGVLQRPLQAGGLGNELALGRLSCATVCELVQAVAPGADAARLARFLYRLSQGNPFILFEGLKELHERGWLLPAAGGQWVLQDGPLELSADAPSNPSEVWRQRWGLLLLSLHSYPG